MNAQKKKIGIQLPRQANPEELAIRYSLELEALDSVAEIIEVAAATSMISATESSASSSSE